jgi:O-antigen/teichoic acid export membrane protein
VAQSVLALSHRDGTGAKAPFLKATCYMTVVAWPFFIFMGLMAYPIVRILFGDQWDEAVPLVRLLSIAALFRSCGLLNLTLLSATGAIARNLRLQIILQPASILLIILASLHGLEWVAGAVIVSAILFVVLSYVAVNELIGNSTRELISALSPSLVVAVTCGAAPLLLTLTVSIGPNNLWPPLILAAIGAALGWTLAVFATRHPITSEIRVLLRARQFSWPRHS